MRSSFSLLLATALAGCQTDPAPKAPPTTDVAPSMSRHVLVVDERAAPVANAEVAFRADFGSGAERQHTVDCEVAFAGLARHRTGTDGVVRLPTGLALAAVIARSGERFGAAQLEFDDRAVAMPILRIAPDRHVHVLVEGPDGKPRSGVPIELFAPASQWDRVRNESTEIMGTDAAGQLTLWHAQTLCDWDLARPLLTLRARVLGAESRGVDVDLRRQLAEPVKLSCPAFGHVVVHRWLAKGVRDGTSPDLRIWPVDPDDEVRTEVGFGAALDGNPGTWRSPPLALGSRWWLQEGSKVADSDGPSSDGQQIAVDWFESPMRGSPRVAATVILRRSDGAPCANETVVLDGPHSGRDWKPRGRTDQDGRITFAAPRPIGWFEFYVPVTHRVASVGMPDTYEPGTILDLGIVTLAAPRRLVSGRLIDAMTRQPVRGKIDLHGGALASDWRTAADGTFTIWDDPDATNIEGDECRVEVSPLDASYAPARRTVRIGATDVVFELERRRLLRCTLLVDSHIGPMPLDVRLRSDDGHDDSLARARSRSGCLEWSCTLPDDESNPGAWELTIAGGSKLAPLHTVGGSEFRPTADGYEVEVDLRGQLAQFDVFCRQLRPFEYQSTLRVRTSGTKDPWRKVHLGRHTSVIARAGTRLDALACPTRSPSVRLTLSPGRTELTLPPNLVFELDVQTPPAPNDRLGAYVVLLRRFEPWFEGALREGFDDQDLRRHYDWPLEREQLQELILGRASISLQPGRRQVEVPRRGRYVIVPSVAQSDGEQLLLDAAVVCETKAPGEVVPVTVRINAEQLRAALAGKKKKGD